MDALRALPIARSATGTQADRDGLLATEALLEQRLTALGYTVTRETFYWTSFPGLRSRPTEATTNTPDDSRFEDTLLTPLPEPLASSDGTLRPDLRPRLGPVGPWDNLIVERRGTTRPNEVILLGAHFDAVPGAPGADDNGTGVAALLELAHVLRDRPLDRTVRMVFFNLEEVGLVGSRYHARQWAATRDRLRAASEPHEQLMFMVSLEMLGYFSDEADSQRSPIPPIPGVFEPPTVGDFIALASTQPHAAIVTRFDEALRRAEPNLKTFATSVFPDIGPGAPRMAIERAILRSDHASFLVLGEPGVILTDTANYRNPHYHTPGDTVDTIDAARFTLVVRAVAGATVDLANAKD
jgi:hypothetical protein